MIPTRSVLIHKKRPGKRVKYNPRNKLFLPWQWQNKLKKGDIPSHSDILTLASRFERKDERALFILMYLTAGRISEIVRSIRKKDIVIKNVSGKECLVIRMPNRKNKKRRYKIIPIPIEQEKQLTRMLSEYLVTLDEEIPVFTFGRSKAYKAIRKTLGFGCHWVRHIRLTHLVTDHNYTDQLLVKVAGWTDSTPAKHYMELRVIDLVDNY